MTRLTDLAVVIALTTGLTETESRSPAPVVGPGNPHIEHPQSLVHETTLFVDAQRHCIFKGVPQQPDQHAAKLMLQPRYHYKVTVSGEARLTPETAREADPHPGVVAFYCTNDEDGYATRYAALKPGDVLTFQSPAGRATDRFLSAFFLDYWPESDNRGQYALSVAGEPAGR